MMRYGINSFSARCKYRRLRERHSSNGFEIPQSGIKGVSMKIEVNEGKLPCIVGGGTAVAGILFAVPLVMYPNGSMAVRLTGYLVVALIICIGIGMCMMGRKRNLLVEDRTLCYTDSFGRKKTFSLDEIGYCRAALEEKGGRDYLKIYDLLGNKLCKLEIRMKNSARFLQYLMDNQVRIECSEASDNYLKSMLCTKTICEEEIPANINACLEEAKKYVWEWGKLHKEFDVDWKMGIAAYLEDELSEKKQLWEQTGCSGKAFPSGLPEGYLLVIEGYLQKDGLFVLDSKGRAVMFYVQVISVSKSFRAGETLKIRFFDNVGEELAWQLGWLAHALPRNRYHMEALSLQHELLERL